MSDCFGSFAHKILVFYVLVATVFLLLIAPPIVKGQTNPPPLTLDAGGGVSAALSDYGLTNYTYSNGVYQGTFCFTLTNTSHQTNGLPAYLIGAGLVGNPNQTRYSLMSYTVPSSFIAADPISSFSGTTSFDVLFVGGVKEGDSATFCMVLTSSTPFSIGDLVGALGVVFNNVVGGCYSTNGDFALPKPYAEIVLTSYSDREIGFFLGNQTSIFAFGTPVNTTVTGFGFDLSHGYGNLSLTAADPTSQNFEFTKARKRLIVPSDIAPHDLDFGFLTGLDFDSGSAALGIPFTGTSSIYTIHGNFNSRVIGDLLDGAVIRFDNGEWGTIRGQCPPPVGGGGIKGVVATNPQ